MNSQTNSLETTSTPERKRLYGGLALIAIGTWLLVSQFLQLQWMGLVILPGLGVIFLLWGLLARNPGLLVPGGILSGIGLGANLVSGPFVQANGETQGAIVLLSFAAGWALITVLSLLIGRRQFWPLIPGGIMAFIGGALLMGGAGLQALELAGRAWPLVLVAIGVAVLVRRK
jgi:hypothetical protein